MNNNDWRIGNQQEYLLRKKLVKGKYKPYRDGWDHEHCEFCSEKIDASTVSAYSTEDGYYWICEKCFHDFCEMFEWKIIQTNHTANGTSPRKKEALK